MHSALLFSMKPMPPMSAARLYTSPRPRRPGSSSFVLQVERRGSRRRRALIPLVERLDVDGADVAVPCRAAGRHEVTADKASGAAYYDFLVFSFH